MRTIVAGSRTWDNFDIMETVLNARDITEVVSGNAKGADELGEWWATKNGVQIKVFPANWSLHGKAAGYIRNEEMAKYADALVAFWDGKSKGTKHMINLAHKYGLQVEVVT